MALTQEFSFKRFSVSGLFVYYGGNYMRADQPVAGAAYTASTGLFYTNFPNYLLNAWTPANTNTDVPGFGANRPVNAGTTANYQIQIAYADTYVQPADFIKLRTATLSYLLPQEVAKKITASNIRLRFQVNNAWTVWTKNKIGIDPESNDNWRGNYQGSGRYLPQQATFIFGLSANF